MQRLPAGWSDCHSACVQSAGQAARADGVPSPVRRRGLATLKQEHEAAMSGMQTRCAELKQELAEGRAIWGEARWAGSSPPMLLGWLFNTVLGGSQVGCCIADSWVAAASSHLGLTGMVLPFWL